jgi:hypothetical protein
LIDTSLESQVDLLKTKELMVMIRILLGVGVGVMAAAIAYALIVGDFWTEAEILLMYPWFHLSMIDLYVGFCLFAGWIVFRERNLLVALVWIALLMMLGNLVSCGYALLVLIRAKGDMHRFWLGNRATSA